MTEARQPRSKETGTLLGVRLQPDALRQLDTFIADQPEPRPTRPEAVRRLLRAALADRSRPVATSADLSREIKLLETEIAKILEPGAPSPQSALGTMDKAIAETALSGLRTRRSQLRKASAK